MDPQKVSNNERIKVTFSYLRSDTSRPKRLRDVQLEYRTANWIANLLQEAPTDFDEWIEDGRVLCRAINKIIFNAVPNDIINAPSNDVKVSSEVRAKIFLDIIQGIGVKDEDLFHPKDLTQMRNIPRVCKCLLKLKQLVDATSNYDDDEDDQKDNDI